VRLPLPTWKLVDTAGIREAEECLEKSGIEIGKSYLSASSFWILVVDGTKGLQKEDIALLDKYRSIPHLIVWNKSDLTTFTPTQSPYHSLIETEKVFTVSAKEGNQIDSLWSELLNRFSGTVNAEEVLPSTSQIVIMEKGLSVLETIKTGLETLSPPEEMAELNRTVLSLFESILGEVNQEEILDKVFGEFCIGK
jgi:tRNA modification GTPase